MHQGWSFQIHNFWEFFFQDYMMHRKHTFTVTKVKPWYPCTNPATWVVLSSSVYSHDLQADFSWKWLEKAWIWLDQQYVSLVAPRFTLLLPYIGFKPVVCQKKKSNWHHSRWDLYELPKLNSSLLDFGGFIFLFYFYFYFTFSPSASINHSSPRKLHAISTSPLYSIIRYFWKDCLELYQCSSLQKDFNQKI